MQRFLLQLYLGFQIPQRFIQRRHFYSSISRCALQYLPASTCTSFWCVDSMMGIGSGVGICVVVVWLGVGATSGLDPFFDDGFFAFFLSPPVSEGDDMALYGEYQPSGGQKSDQ